MSRFLATGMMIVFSLGVAAAQEPGKAGGVMATAGVSKALMDMEHQWIQVFKGWRW